MIPADIFLSIDGDYNPDFLIHTTLPVKPDFDDLINFRGLDTTELSDDFFSSMARLINEHPETIEVIGKINNRGPVESYKDDIIEFLDMAVWHIQTIHICPNKLWISVDFMEDEKDE